MVECYFAILSSNVFINNLISTGSFFLLVFLERGIYGATGTIENAKYYIVGHTIEVLSLEYYFTF